MSIQLSGRIASIYTAPAKGEPMISHGSIGAFTGEGLEGDRYAIGTGAYSHSKISKIRHVSLIAREAIAAANSSLVEQFTEAETRRNLVTEGIDVNQLVGVTFWVGNVVMRGVELCDPCKRPEKLSGKPGFETAFHNLGGLRAEVLASGLIAVNNTISTAQVHSLSAIPVQSQRVATIL